MRQLLFNSVQIDLFHLCICFMSNEYSNKKKEKKQKEVNNLVLENHKAYKNGKQCFDAERISRACNK